MDVLTSTFLLLDPEIQKHSILNESTNENDYLTFDEQLVDLKNTYHYTFQTEHDKLNELKSEITSLFESQDVNQKISSDVLKQSVEVIESFYPSIIEKFDIENLSRTPFGTLVLDWEKDLDNVFSLEIGANKIGYFIEKDGKDVIQIDEEDFTKHKSELFKNLGAFLD